MQSQYSYYTSTDGASYVCERVIAQKLNYKLDWTLHKIIISILLYYVNVYIMYVFF